ncbi:RNA polymerase sigma factor [uncultured Culturomica sp.]|jgi:RNA polymerase sigma-70 factor (ECF subfamily)|uniref:RNA polymerase sigma factor n=1 Tax=uncultured Culturomica sp. TaxID=1926654 RepID=UPI000334F2A5|nr:RNA polymerase sigma factor [uncultured Culturomica sp.]CCZ07920.1 sigma-70 family RNA polymerase sigma factor [Odoribacter sp. CAG:788]
MCDKEIIDRILNGYPQDFRFLVEKYQETVFRTAMGFVHDREDAEDISQETFICAYRSLHNFRGESEFSTWLYRIAVNCCLRQIKRAQKKNLLQRMEDLLQRALYICSEDKNPEETVISKQSEELIRNAIDSLPEKQHIAFTLSKYDEIPQKEIARIMEISEGAVEQLLQRAKINLQKKLKQP